MSQLFARSPVRTQQALNSNMCCWSALICSHTLYADIVCHHIVLPGSRVSRARLMVRCFKNSLSVRTENNWKACLHNLPAILWKKDLLCSISGPPREHSRGNQQNRAYTRPHSYLIHHICTIHAQQLFSLSLFLHTSPLSFVVPFVLRWTAAPWEA